MIYINKKKFILIVIILIIIVVFGIIISKNNKNEDVSNIPEYDADIICKYSLSENVDDTDIDSLAYVYIYTEDNNVSKAIHQSITSSDVDYSLMQSITKLYENINGIDATVNYYGSDLLLEVVYDFNTLDIDDVKDKLGNVLDDQSILMSTDELPISVDDYLDSLTDKYTCNNN